jgi:type I restriction enzyme S subunit
MNPSPEWAEQESRTLGSANGWIETTLEDACIKISDGTHHSPKEQYDEPADGLYKYVTAKNIRMAGLDLANLTYVTQKIHREIYNRCNPELGDVLLTKDGVNAGDVAINTLDEEFSLLSSVALLKPKRDLLEPKFLRYYIESPEGAKRLLGEMRGAAIRRIILRSINAASIPLPPLPEQRRIVARIEELFSRLDAGVAALRQAKAQLQRYRQSVLSAAVTGQLTQAWREKADVTLSEWESVTIDDISEVKTGKTPKRDEPQFWRNGTIPWLTSSATSNDFTHEADQFVTKAALDSGLKLFEPGTLLLAMYGEGKTRGQVTEITFQATCNQACAAIILNDARAFRPFVKLRLQECYEQTRKAASGGNQPNLNLSKVREIPLQLPPLAEQHQIVAEVEARTTAIEHLEAELDRQITRSKRLRQATLRSAFTGRL